MQWNLLTYWHPEQEKCIKRETKDEEQNQLKLHEINLGVCTSTECQKVLNIQTKVSGDNSQVSSS